MFGHVFSEGKLRRWASERLIASFNEWGDAFRIPSRPVKQGCWGKSGVRKAKPERKPHMRKIGRRIATAGRAMTMLSRKGSVFASRAIPKQVLRQQSRIRNTRIDMCALTSVETDRGKRGSNAEPNQSRYTLMPQRN